MSFPDGIKALPRTSAVDQITMAVLKVVRDDEAARGADRLWEDVILVEGRVDPGSIKAGKLYVKGIPVKPKEWGGQRATVSTLVSLCGVFPTENADGDSDLLGTRAFCCVYAPLMNRNIQLYDDIGQKINVAVMDWWMDWERVAAGRGFRIVDMNFQYQTDTDPRDGTPLNVG